MKKVSKFIAVCLLVSMLGCQKQAANILTEEMFANTAKKQVEMAKQKAGTLQLATVFKNIDASGVIFAQEEGNAGELYWQVFKNHVDTRTPEEQALLGQMNALGQAFDTEFKAAENAKITPQLVELAKTEAQKLAELPELAQIEKAAKRKTMFLIGETIAIPENIRSVQVVSPTILRGYGTALLGKALLKEAAGDKVAAEAAFQTLIAVGQHFAQDANYFHYTAGMSMMLIGALSIKQFYERTGNKEKQAAAEKLEKETNEQLTKFYDLGAMDPDKQAFNIIDGLGYLDEGIEALASLATTDTAPAGLRAKAIESLFSGYTFRYSIAEKSGKPAESTEYAPPSDARLQALAKIATSNNKAIAQMANAAKQTLEKMKGQNSAERAKYWKEVSSKKG